jgi:DNA-directed RNA polymerase specialized sigma24 family protein
MTSISETVDPLVAAAEEGRTGDVVKAVELIYQSGLLDRMPSRLRTKWSFLQEEDTSDLIVSEALDDLYVALRNGRRVDHPATYLWKIADRKAFHAQRSYERRHAAEDSFARKPVITTDEDAEARRRAEAIRVARSLLPRLGHVNAQRVLEYVFDAIEAERADITYDEIAEITGMTRDAVRKAHQRGFERLRRLVRDEGLAPITVVVAQETANRLEEDWDESTDE